MVLTRTSLQQNHMSQPLHLIPPLWVIPQCEGWGSCGLCHNRGVELVVGTVGLDEGVATSSRGAEVNISHIIMI